MPPSIYAATTPKKKPPLRADVVLCNNPKGKSTFTTITFSSPYPFNLMPRASAHHNDTQIASQISLLERKKTTTYIQLVTPAFLAVYKDSFSSLGSPFFLSACAVSRDLGAQ